MQVRSITAPNPGAFTLDGTRTWLLGASTVIDPGPAIESHVDAILAASPAITTILITHRHGDHAPGAVLLRDRCGARILAPRDVLSDADVGQRLAGGEHLDVEGESLSVIATPGHTGEHVCFLTEDRQLFSGDTVLGYGTTAIFPPDGDMGDYIASLKKLRALEPRVIHPAHGPSREDAMSLIDEYIEHRLAREREVVGALNESPLTIPALRRRIYPELDPRLERAAEAQLLAHVLKLQKEARVNGRNGVWAAH